MMCVAASVVPIMCDALSSVEDMKAKAALVWIIGEYAAQLENPTAKLEPFLENFETEGTQTQLALITATAKVYLKVSAIPPPHLV
jgi:Adaptin N terminal region